MDWSRSWQAGILAAKGILRKSYVIQNIPKCVVSSWAETGARIIFSRFLERFIVVGCVTWASNPGFIMLYFDLMNSLKFIACCPPPSFEFIWWLCVCVKRWYSKFTRRLGYSFNLWRYQKRQPFESHFESSYTHVLFEGKYHINFSFG